MPITKEQVHYIFNSPRFTQRGLVLAAPDTTACFQENNPDLFKDLQFHAERHQKWLGNHFNRNEYSHGVLAAYLFYMECVNRDLLQLITVQPKAIGKFAGMLTHQGLQYGLHGQFAWMVGEVNTIAPWFLDRAFKGVPATFSQVLGAGEVLIPIGVELGLLNF
jgi:hypothetical protein